MFGPGISVGDIEYEPATVAHAGGYDPIVVRGHHNAQSVVYHYWIAELSFELKPWFRNQGLQYALSLFFTSPKRLIQKNHTRCGHPGIEATGELLAISDMCKVFAKDLSEGAGDYAFACPRRPT
jgi:hypothetical protein